jgi:hypothetical protein
MRVRIWAVRVAWRAGRAVRCWRCCGAAAHVLRHQAVGSGEHARGVLGGTEVRDLGPREARAVAVAVHRLHARVEHEQRKAGHTQRARERGEQHAHRVGVHLERLVDGRPRVGGGAGLRRCSRLLDALGAKVARQELLDALRHLRAEAVHAQACRVLQGCRRPAAVRRRGMHSVRQHGAQLLQPRRQLRLARVDAAETLAVEADKEDVQLDRQREWRAGTVEADEARKVARAEEGRELRRRSEREGDREGEASGGGRHFGVGLAARVGGVRG